MHCPTPETNATLGHSADSITLRHDPQTDEWVFDLSPGLDLLEVVRVLGMVQQQALNLMQRQLLEWQMSSSQSVSAIDGGTAKPNRADIGAES